MMLNACTRTVYIEPMKIKTFYLDDCKIFRIVPNANGSLSKDNHLKLRKSMICHRDRHIFYKKQLEVIKGEDDN